MPEEYGGEIGAPTSENINSAFFEMLQGLPQIDITSGIAIILVVLFFVSGADANTFALSMLSSRGSLNPTKPVLTIWGALAGLCAALLLLMGGLGARSRLGSVFDRDHSVIEAVVA